MLFFLRNFRENEEISKRLLLATVKHALKVYINAESVNNFSIENYFDENISLIGTGKHELFTNLHEFLESFKFDVKRRGKIRLEVRNLHQEEGRLAGDHVLAHGTVDFVGLFKDGSICFKMETKPVDMNILVPTMMKYL